MLFLKHKSHVKELERRNWKDIKNKPLASKQLFLTVHEFTVFSNKFMSLWDEAGEEMWPDGTTESESGVPTGTWTACARHINPPCHHFYSCKTERYLLSLVPLVGNVNE